MAKSKITEWLTEEGIALLQGWARDGLTDVEIATNMGINVSTLYVYKNSNQEISNALKKGKEVSDRIVEGQAYKNAMGYEYDEEVPFKVKKAKFNKDGRKIAEEESIITVKVRKFKPSDPASVFFWLKNRMPDVWRDRFQQDIFTPEPIKTVDMSKISTDELKQLKSILKDKEKDK